MKAVLFDAGNTLLEMDYPLIATQLRMRGHAVTDAGVANAERRARVRLDEEQAAQPTGERRGAGRYFRYLLANLGIDDAAELAALTTWRRHFNLPVGLCHRPNAEAVAALSRLRAARITTGVISNSNGSVRRSLERIGLAVHFDFVIDSTLVGVRKPDPRIFVLGLDAARVDASDAAYIGDSYFADVLGAGAVGMRGVLFDPGDAWGRRDCRRAGGLCAAVELALVSSAR
jgi:putative hydrolase of the HAD superfamily